MSLTLQTIRNHGLRERSWKTLNEALGNPSLRTEISIGDVLIANDLDDALRCLQCLPPRQRIGAIMPAVKRVSVHTTDQRVHDCIAALDRWLAGDDAVDLNAAMGAAMAAAEAAMDAAAKDAWDVDVFEAAAWAACAAADADADRAASWASWAASWAAWVTAAKGAGAAKDAARTAWALAADADADAARAAERSAQQADLLAVFPPMILEGKE